MTNEKVYAMPFAKVYPLLIAKAERKGRTKAEADTLIRWLTGYTQEALEEKIAVGASYEEFFREAPEAERKYRGVKGTVCGVRVQEVEEPLMRKIRALDKLIDDLAKGKPTEKIIHGYE